MCACKEVLYRDVRLIVFENGDIYTPQRIVQRKYRSGKIVDAVANRMKLATRIDKDGYLRVRINNRGKRIYVPIHRLIAIAFIPNPNNYPCINHKDEDKTNNNIDNLEWCTVMYNNHYNERYKRIKHYARRVEKLDINGNYISTYNSIRDAALSVNGDPSNIGSCAHNRLKTAYGYKWRFA